MRLLQKLTILLACVLVPMGMPASAQPAAPSPGILAHPRYKADPIFLFFENYVLDRIGHLHKEKAAGIQGMHLQKVFKTRASEWREVLRETLHLSDTIDIAILDLWYTNREIARQQGMVYEPQQFAINFTDEYMKDGSKVDVWPVGALAAAKQRIAKAQAKEKRH